MQVIDLEFRPGGLVVWFDDGSEVTGTFAIRNGVLYLDGFDAVQQQALAFFKANQIDNVARLDPRLAIGKASELPPIPAFQIIQIPDTQNYSDNSNTTFNTMTTWIANNIGSNNIKFVSHIGDVVEDADTIAEWEFADAAMSIIDGAVPYSTVLGNHDYDPTGDRTPGNEVNYINYFGPSRYAAYTWFQGSSPSGQSTYQIFIANARTYLHIGLELEVDDGDNTDLAWAKSILEANCEYPTIISGARLLRENNTLAPTDQYGGSSGQEIFDELCAPYPQVFMALCGHFHTGDGEGYLQATNDAGSAVHIILSDYQDYPNDGDGWLRIIEFDEQESRIRVSAYSPSLNDVNPNAGSAFNIVMDFEDRLDVEHCPEPTESPSSPGSTPDPGTGVGLGSLWMAGSTAGSSPTVSNATLLSTGIADKQVVFTDSLTTGQPVPTRFIDIAVDSSTDRVFWTEPTADVIWVGEGDGSNQRVFVNQPDLKPTGLEIDSTTGHLYYTCIADPIGDGGVAGGFADGQIRRVNLDGTNDIPVLTGLSNPVGITLDVVGRQVFGSDSGVAPFPPPHVGKADITDISDPDIVAGTAVEIFNDPSAAVGGIRNFRGKLWLCDENNGLWRGDYSGNWELYTEDISLIGTVSAYRIAYVDGDDEHMLVSNVQGDLGFNQFLISRLEIDLINKPTEFTWSHSVLGGSEDISMLENSIIGIAVGDQAVAPPPPAALDARFVTTLGFNSILAIPGEQSFCTFTDSGSTCQSGLTVPLGVAVDTRIRVVDSAQTVNAYYTEGPSAVQPPANTVNRRIVGGTDADDTVIANSIGEGPVDIAVDETNDRLIWLCVGSGGSNMSDGAVVVSDLDGTNQYFALLPGEVALYSPTACVWDETVQSLFFTDSGSFSQAPGNIWRMFQPDPVGQPQHWSTELIWTGAIAPTGIAVDETEGHIYWAIVETLTDTGKIYRMNRDGTALTVLKNFTGASIAPLRMMLDIDQRRLWWGQFTKAPHKLQYMDIDTLISGEFGPDRSYFGMALVTSGLEP